MKSTATARWEGKAGKVSAASKLFTDTPYGLKSRFEGGVAETTPEELIAAAHAACYSMAVSVGLGKAGIEAKSVQTSAEVEVVAGSGGANITGSTLTSTVEAPGADAAKVREVAEGASKGCPVSKALAGTKITLNLTVKT
jgi:osmotically inducible protein OsmC